LSRIFPRGRGRGKRKKVAPGSCSSGATENKKELVAAIVHGKKRGSPSFSLEHKQRTTGSVSVASGGEGRKERGGRSPVHLRHHQKRTGRRSAERLFRGSEEKRKKKEYERRPEDALSKEKKKTSTRRWVASCGRGKRRTRSAILIRPGKRGRAAL